MRNTAKSIFIALLFLPFLAESQTFVSLKAGLVSTPFANSDFEKYSSYRKDFNHSFSVAASIEKHGSKVFSFGLGIYYDRYDLDYYHYWYNPMGGNGSAELTLNADYLAFFIYPQFGFGNKLRFYFNFGPYIGIVLHTHKIGSTISKKDMHTGTTYSTVDGSAEDLFNYVTLSVLQSIGLELSLKNKWKLFTEFNARMGMSVLSRLYRQLDLKFNIGFRYKLNDKRADLKSVRPPNY